MSPKEGTPNPPSTFPGIWKYPTERVAPFRGPLDWLAGKKKDDDVGDLWRVHDKLYDVTPFIKNHPGGSEFLEMTRGLDITEAFESSHFVNSDLVDATLAKFYVRDADTPRNSPYTFRQDGFYKTLKRAAEPILKKVGTGSTKGVLLMQDGLILAFVLLSTFGVYWNSLVLKLLAGITLTMAANASHNFVHMKENWRRYYMDCSLLSSYEWRASHSLSHHLYPNTVLDAEMSLSEPWFSFMPTKSKTWFRRYGPILYAQPFFLVIHWIPWTVKWISVFRRKTTLHPQDLIVFLQLIFLIPFASNISDAVVSWLIIHTACSYYFGLFSFTVAHHHPSIWHDGDESRADADFGLCQLDAVRERSETIYKHLFFVMTRYGEHSLHHLFPTVCHSKLIYLKPALEETLLKFKEEIFAFPEWELFCGMFQQLQKTEPGSFKYLIKSSKNE